VTDEVKLDPSATRLAQNDANSALSLALHEIGHALGLDHDKVRDSVMNPAQQVPPTTEIGKSDITELKSLYTSASSVLNDTVVVLGSEEFRYDLSAEWAGGGDIAMVQVFTDGAPIGNVITPLGWMEVTYNSSSNPDVLSFRVAPTDTSQAYLSASNPIELFTFESPFSLGPVLAWAGDFHTVLGPTPAPEPPALSLLVGALATALGFRIFCGSYWPSSNCAGFGRFSHLKAH
jgi:hypothetical protein